jgi:hypothetical protein
MCARVPRFVSFRPSRAPLVQVPILLPSFFAPGPLPSSCSSLSSSPVPPPSAHRPPPATFLFPPLPALLTCLSSPTHSHRFMGPSPRNGIEALVLTSRTRILIVRHENRGFGRKNDVWGGSEQLYTAIAEISVCSLISHRHPSQRGKSYLATKTHLLIGRPV